MPPAQEMAAQTDRDGRFKLSERRGFPLWLVLLIFVIVPFGPWFVGLPICVLAAIFLLISNRRSALHKR